MGWHEILGYSSKGLDPHKGEMSIQTDARSMSTILIT